MRFTLEVSLKMRLLIILFGSLILSLSSCQSSNNNQTGDLDDLDKTPAPPTAQAVFDWHNYFKNPPNIKERNEIEIRLSHWKEATSIPDLLKKGKNEVALGRLNAAEASFRQILRLDPENREALLELSQLYLRQKMFSKSLDALSDLHDKISLMEIQDPGFVLRYRYILALAYIGQKDIEKGRLILTDILSTHRSFSPGYSALATSYLVPGKLETAEFIANQGLDRGQEDPSLFNILGIVNMQKGNSEVALNYFNRALSLSQTFTPALVNRARIAISRFELSTAEEDLSKVLIYEPHHADALVLLGICQKRTGKLAEAKASFTKAMDADPNNASARFNLAVLLTEHFNRHNEALRLFDEVLNLEIDDLELKEKSKHYITNLMGKHDAL